MAVASEIVGAYPQSTPLPQGLLQGKVAVVTGASRGIGRATALRLAEAGADVVLNYLEQHDAAVEVQRHITDRLGRHAIAVGGNVADPGRAETVVQAALDAFGKLDLLVANAGIWAGAPIECMEEELWDRVLDTNLKGTWTCCRAAVRQMKQQCSGSIVIVSSTAGQRGEAGYSNYAASKGGQISFTKALATELAPYIRVNCVAPGWVDTELNTEVFDERREEIAESIPLKRVATADDVALAIAFLASDWARHITGEVLNVNGGSVLCG